MTATNGPELVAELADTPNIDEFYKRVEKDPRLLTFPDDFSVMVRAMRAERARWNITQQKRKDKRDGVEDAEDDTTQEAKE